MSEPLREDIVERLRQTQQRALLPRKVDLPVVGPETRVGTLCIPPRPVRVLPVGSHVCGICNGPFVRINGRQIYCGLTCADIAAKAKSQVRDKGRKR